MGSDGDVPPKIIQECTLGTEKETGQIIKKKYLPHSKWLRDWQILTFTQLICITPLLWLFVWQSNQVNSLVPYNITVLLFPCKVHIVVSKWHERRQQRLSRKKNKRWGEKAQDIFYLSSVLQIIFCVWMHIKLFISLTLYFIKVTSHIKYNLSIWVYKKKR